MIKNLIGKIKSLIGLPNENFKLKMYDVEVANDGFFTKRYIFKKKCIGLLWDIPI